MAIHRNKRFVGVGKQARLHEGHLGAELPPQSKKCAPPSKKCVPPSEDCAQKK